MLQTKVSQLKLPTVVDQEILRFEVSVKDFTSVTVVQTSQQLKQEQLDIVHMNAVSTVI